MPARVARQQVVWTNRLPQAAKPLTVVRDRCRHPDADADTDADESHEVFWGHGSSWFAPPLFARCTGNRTTSLTLDPSTNMPFTSRDFEEIRQEVAQFAEERDWNQFHSPRNLLLALVGEVGEAAEIVRWQGDNDPAIPAGKEDDWADELADVLTLLIRLADRSGVDLTAAFARKLAKARAKYPVDGFKGSNRKYNEPRASDR